MKKAITRALSLLMVCMLMLGMSVVSNATDNAIPGDVNNDGELTIFDVLFIVKSIVNGIDLENSDVNGDGKTNLLDVINAVRLITTGETPEVGDSEKGTADVVVENGTVKEAVSINGEKVSAAVPEGVAVEDGTTELTLTVSALDSTAGNITTGEDDEVVSYDVHIEGVSEENTVAIVVDLGAILPVGQNIGTVELYHVENGDTVKMTQVMSLADLDEHNEFYYYPETGNVYVAMATFSEVSAVANSVNPWNGNFDYSWYDEAIESNPNETSFTIANADQLVAFGAIVGGMDGRTVDSFAGKTVTLSSDINLGYTGKEGYNVYYPIGYYNSTGSYTPQRGVSGITSSFLAFEGTFDGAGHTVANIYQNTWDMFGDYNNGYSGTPNYYKDGMGLFGWVNNATVKNLTVANFTSDGEFACTGVICSGADNSTFENIAIVDCNPRAYNNGNGGIVGWGGTYGDSDQALIVFRNITVDNSNKISALWGSWDVPCGGLMGGFCGNGRVEMYNCHVAAQIDVNNDVCGNYQYYWYRYAGMLIGTNENMVTDDNGYTVPKIEQYYAEDCTVHFDTWNDYYYCELVANSLASYTHDHQFSRLEIIDGEGKIQDAEGNWNRTGNFIVLGKNGVNTCYHIVKKDGKFVRHLHEDAGYETKDINGDGKIDSDVLLENNQCVYLPFNQLFTGYGWGVKHIPIYDDDTQNPFKGVTIRDREYTDSIIKFTGEDKYYTDGMTVNASDLFTVKENLTIGLKADNVIVSVTPAANSKASATVTKGASWQDTKIKFAGTGNLMIAIQDYYFCTPTIINVTILDGEHYHIDVDGTSDLKWVKNGSKFDLKCNGCGKVIKTSDKPVVYLDHAGSDKDSYNFSLGVSKDYPVRTLKEASKRLENTGGTITLTSDIVVGSTGINNPKDIYQSGVVNKMTPWKERVTFSGDRDGNGVADCGFVIDSHGAGIHFGGPTTFEKLIIDGRDDTYVNNTDSGNYHIPVFVADWNDFTFGEGITAYSPIYFIVGNHFYRTNGDLEDTDERLYIQAYVDDYEHLTRDTTDRDFYADGNHYTSDLVTEDGKQKTVNIVLNKINSEIIREIDGETVVAEPYDRVYIGTRNRTYDDLTVKNVHVNVISNDAAFNFVYAGSASGSYKYEDGKKVNSTVNDPEGTVTYVVDTQMENCSVDVAFNGSKSANAYVRYFRVGNSNSGTNGSAYLDKLDMELNGTFYIKDSSAEPNKDKEILSEKHFTVANVIDAKVTVSSGNARLNSNGELVLNQEQIYYSLSEAYKNVHVNTTDETQKHINKVDFTYGSHSFLWSLYLTSQGDTTPVPAQFNAGYDKNNNLTKHFTDECTFTWADKASDPLYQVGTCTVCDRTEERISVKSYHEHTDVYLTGSAGNYALKCATCGTVTMYKQPECDDTENNKPIIYVDPKKTNSNSSDNNLGFDEDNAVVSVGVAVKRVVEDGGILKFMSNIELDSNGFNHPFGNKHKISDSWSKEIIFSSCYTDKNGDPSIGFKTNSHGAAVFFNGPVKLKDILIDGRSNTMNSGAYYNTTVFVTNWYSFATKGDVVSYGASYLVVGHYFANNHTVADYADKGLPYFTYSSTSGGLSDLTGKATQITLNKTTPKSFKVNDTTQEAVETFTQVYLGNRNATPVTSMTSANKAQYICKTKGADITFSCYTDVGVIYVGGTGLNKKIDNTTVLTAPVSGSSIAIGLHPGTTTQQVLMGTETYHTKDTGLDSLSIHLYENAYINKDTPRKDYSIVTRNVKNLTIDADGDKKQRVFGEVLLRTSDEPPADTEKWNLTLSVGGHVFAHEKGIQYNSRYTNVNSKITNECTYDSNGTCTVCGAEKASS